MRPRRFPLALAWLAGDTGPAERAARALADGLHNGHPIRPDERAFLAQGEADATTPRNHKE